MFYGPQAAFAWIASIWLIDWRRWRELLPYGLWGSVICTVEDRISWVLHLWEYRDTGPLGSHLGISGLIAVSAAPLVGMYFAQKLRPGAPAPWGRMIRISAVALIPEAVGLYTGNIVYIHWSFALSVLSYPANWLTFWWLHRWLAGTEPLSSA